MLRVGLPLLITGLLEHARLPVGLGWGGVRSIGRTAGAPRLATGTVDTSALRALPNSPSQKPAALPSWSPGTPTEQGCGPSGGG